jgi:hypothetical protein
LYSATGKRRGLRKRRLRPRPQGTRRARRLPMVLLLAVLAFLGNTFPAFTQADVPTEYQLKAAFLFNFAKFVDWPAGSFSSPQSPFFICILGVDPFGHVMDDTLQGKTIGAHAVVIQRVKDSAELRHCQMTFVSSSERLRVPEIIEASKGTSTLLVGESAGFAVAGGAIQFDLEENRVRFLINTDAAERAGLRVSSKLLSLAKVVHDAVNNGRS